MTNDQLQWWIRSRILWGLIALNALTVDSSLALPVMIAWILIQDLPS